MKVTIATATDANYFYLAQCLISSIHDNKSPDRDIEIGLLDVGLTPEQRSKLVKLVDNIVTPDWDFDFPGKTSIPIWFKKKRR